jgi:hypothetical protein
MDKSRRFQLSTLNKVSLLAVGGLVAYPPTRAYGLSLVGRIVKTLIAVTIFIVLIVVALSIMGSVWAQEDVDSASARADAPGQLYPDSAYVPAPAHP